MRCRGLALFSLLGSVHALAPVVVFGPGSLELRLLTAKLAARAGYASSIYAGSEQQGMDKRFRRLMYGKEAESDAQGNARIIVDLEDLGSCLSTAEALVCVCDSQPLAEDALLTLLNNTPKCSRIVLISKMGVTRATAGFMGLGSEDVAILQGEQAMRKEATARGIGLSVVRVGTLKGGGPGGNAAIAGSEGTLPDDEALGLTKVFYDGLAELDVYLTTSAYDKFTLGAKLVKGDPVDLPNPIMRAARKSSFEPSDDETNRIVAATAVVKAIDLGRDVEFSVSSAKAEAMPTNDDWEIMLADM